MVKSPANPLNNPTKVLAYLNIAIVVFLCLVVTATGFSKWGKPHARTQGTVTRITPEQHRYIYSEYTIDGIHYTTVGSGDYAAYQIGSPIDVFYRVDRPDIATYYEDRFSFLDDLNFVLLGTVFFTIFIWTIGRRILVSCTFQPQNIEE